MKKLIVAFIAILSCVSVQAAVVQWGVLFGLTASGTPLDNVTVMTFFAPSGESMDSTWDALAKGGNPMELTGFGSAHKVTDGSQTIEASQLIADENSYAGKGLRPSTMYDFYLVVIDEESRAFTIYEEVITDLTPDWNSELPARDTTISWFAPDFSDATWTKIVPEPTALALLALGVAGVALRRRKCA